MARPSDALKLSGLLGILSGMVIGLYQVLLRDPMVFGEAIASPVWMIGAHVHFFGLSLIVLFYGFFIDDLFEGYQLVTTVFAIIRQWGLPLVLVLAHGLNIMQLNALQLPLALINIAVILAFIINFGRREL